MLPRPSLIWLKRLLHFFSDLDLATVHADGFREGSGLTHSVPALPQHVHRCFHNSSLPVEWWNRTVATKLMVAHDVEHAHADESLEQFSVIVGALVKYIAEENPNV